MNINPNVFIFSAVTVAGIGVAIWGWRIRKRSLARAHWPHTEGVIVASRPGLAENDLLPRIEFAYTVDGREYHTVFRFPEGTHPLPEFTQSYLDKYPEGKAVTVYYDPQNPAEATLEPVAHDDWMVLAAGIVTAIGGALALLLH